MRRAVCTVALSFVVLALVAVPGFAGGGGHGALCASFATGPTIVMRDSCFDGVAQFADPGAKLSIANEGGVPHSYTAVDGSFDTGMLEPGERASIDVSDPGVYRVYCTLHGTRDGIGMAGVLLVGDTAARAGTAADSSDGAAPSGVSSFSLAGWTPTAALFASVAAIGLAITARAVARRRT